MVVKKSVVNDSFVFTIFGASGDLARLKIFPSLYELALQGRFEGDYWIIGYARSEMELDEFRGRFNDSIREAFKENWSERHESILQEMLKKVFYQQGMYDELESFKKYGESIKSLTNNEFVQELCFFSVPPVAFQPIVNNMAAIREDSNLRSKVKLIIEKPFGEDYKSAKDLFHCISNSFKESQVYLLDHYLGKLPQRSILRLREKNRIMNLLIDSSEISNIQVSALETLEVEERLGYYDKVGATKDMIQSHLLQLFCLIGMEIPVRVDTESVALNKHFILSSLEFEKGVIGQYEDFCEAKKYQCSPFTDTYASCRLMVNNTHWYGIPIFIRTGKSLAKKQTSVVVEFTKYEHQDRSLPANRLEFEIAPNPSVRIVMSNETGYDQHVSEVVTQKSIMCEGDDCMQAHAVLFLDALLDKKMFFLKFDQILDSWKIIDKMKESLAGKRPEIYKKGSNGPSAGDDLIEETGFKWINF